MLEFNQWFFVLVANFLILFFILKAILFEPLHKFMKERDNSIQAALESAKALTAQKEDAFAKMKAELQSARAEAKQTYDALRAEGQNIQKEILSKAEAEAVAMLLKAREEIQAEAQKARLALKPEIDKYADEIVKKLVKA